jgi:hypothetical protein
VVVVHEEEEKCRDAIYNNAAGSGVAKAVAISGFNLSRGKNNTIQASQWQQR